jgi:hypothetical protein
LSRRLIQQRGEYMIHSHCQRAGAVIRMPPSFGRQDLMRVTSDLFVCALLRRVFSSGGYGAIINRGAHEAGAIFVSCRERTGETVLYGPAAQASYDSARPQERLFAELKRGGEEEIGARLQKERRFDPDIWIVEIEAGSEAPDALLAITKP